jgi:hypothetical protein
MNYLLAPLHTHRDLGFGATGNAFKAAADHLDGSEEFKKNGFFGTHLPTNYLYRHAIELHLKSAIVIFHRKFRLPYGEFAFDSEPRVQVGDKWKVFREVHGIETLWTYVRQLFATHGEWLAADTKCNWEIDPETDSWVQAVQSGDPRSTFFRYPTTNNLASDAVKSKMKEVTADGLMEMLGKSEEGGQKVFAMVVENEDKEFVRAYVNDGAADSSFRDVGVIRSSGRTN